MKQPDGLCADCIKERKLDRWFMSVRVIAQCGGCKKVGRIYINPGKEQDEDEEEDDQ